MSLTPRLTLTKSWYGFSDADAQVVLRAFENPESVTPTEHLDLTQKPAKISALIDRVLLTAVIGDLLAHTMRIVAKQELRIAKLEGELAQLAKLKLHAVEEEEKDADTYNDGTIGPRVAEPGGAAV